MTTPPVVTLWYRDMTVYDLGVLPRGVSSVATGINNSGQIVGYATVAAGVDAPTHAIAWNMDQFATLAYSRRTTYRAPPWVSTTRDGSSGVRVSPHRYTKKLAAAPSSFTAKGTATATAMPGCMLSTFCLEARPAMLPESTAWARSLDTAMEPSSIPSIRLSNDIIVWAANGAVKFYYGSIFSGYRAWGMNDTGTVAGEEGGFGLLPMNRVPVVPFYINWACCPSGHLHRLRRQQ